MEVTWTPRALRQLRKIADPVAQRRIVTAVASLRSFPDVRGIRALVNHRYGYRLRVGQWRVLFDVLPSAGVVSIEEVRRRDERTY